MHHTRVDDLLLEMIFPKIKKVEEKFSQAQGLSQDDIHTLLLKSQYKHIHHLDDKLNVVTASVQALENKFELKFAHLETVVTQKLEGFATKMNAFSTKMDANAAATDVKIKRAMNTNMRWSIGLIGLIVTVLKLADMWRICFCNQRSFDAV